MMNWRVQSLQKSICIFFFLELYVGREVGYVDDLALFLFKDEVHSFDYDRHLLYILVSVSIWRL